MPRSRHERPSQCGGEKPWAVVDSSAYLLFWWWWLTKPKPVLLPKASNSVLLSYRLAISYGSLLFVPSVPCDFATNLYQSRHSIFGTMKTTNCKATMPFLVLLWWSAILLAGTAAQRTDLPPRPSGRFVPFRALASAAQTAAVQALGYANATWWNLLSLEPPVEALEYDSLSVAQKAGAATAMGIVVVDNEDDAAESWDCWINHYNNYDWIELGQNNNGDGADVQAWWEALGWNQALWDNGVGTPAASDDLAWDELSEQEREAATYLCYEQISWDGINLETLAVPSAAPVTATPTFEGQTREPTLSPTTGVPTMVVTGTPTGAYVRPSDTIAWRFTTSWADLPSDIRLVLETIVGYTAEMWNAPSSANAVEEMQWDSLTIAQQTALTESLGWSADIWNCHINHYSDYDWQDLVDEGVQQYWLALGWTEASWLGQITAPTTEDADWIGLSAGEQAAATQLCYFEGL